MANILKGRNLAYVGAGVGALLVFRQTRTGQKIDPVRSDDSNPIETNAVANVNKRFSAAGGTETGTPAQAAPTTTMAVSQGKDSKGEYQYENSVAGSKPSGSSYKDGVGADRAAMQGGGPSGKKAPVEPAKQNTEGSGKQQHHGNARDIPAGAAG